MAAPLPDGRRLALPAGLRRFLFPRLDRRFALRFLAVVLATIVICRYVALPMWIQGVSMEPTYRDGAFNVCLRPRYLFDTPEPGDVVVIRLAGPSHSYLKRIVAREGQTVAFQDGALIVDGRPVDEPYVVRKGRWDRTPVTVRKGHFYVVGDNRALGPDAHVHGQVAAERILGGLAW